MFTVSMIDSQILICIGTMLASFFCIGFALYPYITITNLDWVTLVIF